MLQTRQIWRECANNINPQLIGKVCNSNQHGMRRVKARAMGLMPRIMARPRRGSDILGKSTPAQVP